MSKSTSHRRSDKPIKPRPDFPLFPHATRRWAKKVRGRLHYFGPWDDPDGALAKWLEQKDDLLAGRKPRTPSDDLTLGELCNRFLSSKRNLLDAGELSPRTWRDYYDCCETLVESFGKNRAVEDLAGDDFEKLRGELAKRRGAVSLGNEIQRVRTIFKYAFDEVLLDRPVRFGTVFKKPSRKMMRRAKQESGDRTLEASELLTILDAAQQPLRAMILLGLNCGFGQSDVASLPLDAIDLDGGYIDFPRPKTAVFRRCPLWPETVTALREALAERPAAKDEADARLVFITKYGNRWVRSRDRAEGGAVIVDSVGLEFRKLLDALELKRRGSFYNLRHTFRTVADASKDQPALDCIMGHADESMAARYREGVGDERLQAVVGVVRAWLWPAESKAGQGATILPFTPAAG